MSKTDEAFSTILIDAVDHGLLILGPSARKAIYFHLEKDYSLTRDRFPENMRAFTECMTRIFGAGAQVIERLILEELQSQLGIKIEHDARNDFLSCLDKAKEEYLNGTESQTRPLTGPQLQSSLKYRR